MLCFSFYFLSLFNQKYIIYIYIYYDCFFYGKLKEKIIEKTRFFLFINYRNIRVIEQKIAFKFFANEYFLKKQISICRLMQLFQ